MSNSVQVLYTANMGLATFNTANSNVDGTGSLTSIITGATNGTLVKTLIIKAETSTSVGMLRFYVQKSGGSKNLHSEVYVPPITRSGRDATFSRIIPLNYTLASGEVLWASTEHGDTFNVIAEGFDISYSTSTSFLGGTVEYTPNAGSNKVTTANSNLDGTGATVQIVQAGSAAAFSGCVISSIKIKAEQSTTNGAVRLFIADNSGMNPPVLFSEIIVPAMTQGSTTPTFGCEAISQGCICLPPSYSIYASTENTETFAIIVDAQDWKNV